VSALARLAREHLRHFEDRGADTSLPYAELMACRAAAEVMRAVAAGRTGYVHGYTIDAGVHLVSPAPVGARIGDPVLVIGGGDG
jgi:hypothetical protein